MINLKTIIPSPIRKQIKNFLALAFKYGQFKTIRKWDCISDTGSKIPWYTYPAIEFLNNIDFSDKSIFEYGSGNSSFYWSQKASKVVSIEHNQKWYERNISKANANQVFILKNDSPEYENSIKTQNNKFDVIIIDGIRRFECSKSISSFLSDSPDGYIVILDNSDWYKNTSKFLREKLDLIEADFHGFGPINDYTWTTSIFFSRNYNFKPINNVQPIFSRAGLKQSGERK